MTERTSPDVLEQRAEQQRRQLHHSLTELRGTLQQKMDVRRNLRPYVAPVSGAAAVLGLVMGYGFAGMFTRD